MRAVFAFKDWMLCANGIANFVHYAKTRQISVNFEQRSPLFRWRSSEYLPQGAKQSRYVMFLLGISVLQLNTYWCVFWYYLEHSGIIRTLLRRVCERSGIGAEDGAERAENWMSGSGAVSGSGKISGARTERECGFMERERSGEQTKLAAQISLSGDATQPS